MLEKLITAVWVSSGLLAMFWSIRWIVASYKFFKADSTKEEDRYIVAIRLSLLMAIILWSVFYVVS